MREILWFIWCVTYFKKCNAQYGSRYPDSYAALNPIETYHYPGAYTTTGSPFVNGTQTKIPDTSFTPDFRLEEPPFVAAHTYNIETDRPYRLSPHFKTTAYYFTKYERAGNLGCYCVTTYKRIIPLGGGLVITTRHILTTATSTDVVLRHYKQEMTLENIIGAWYDTDAKTFNSSMYMTPCRIHYHPKYIRPREVNVSHAVPAVYDLALWTATFRFQGFYLSINGAVICQRAVAGSFQYVDPLPRPGDLNVIVGFQFMKAYNRRPMPWFKYGIRITGSRYEFPCPKLEWGWFICFKIHYLKYGIDSGAGLHFMDRGRTWRNDGVVGLGAFSMFLRSKMLTHYFTVLDTYPVLDFIYEAQMNLFEEEYLDNRFVNSKYRAPILYWGEYLDQQYHYGKEYCNYSPPNYRR